MASSSESKLVQFWNERQNRLYVLIGGLFLLVALVYVWALKPPPPPPLETGDTEQNDIGIAASKIVEYVREHRNLPTTLAEVDAAFTWEDSWKQPYVFTPGTAGTLKKSFSLRSVGKDGAPETEDDFVFSVRFGINLYKDVAPELSESTRGK